MSLRKKSLEVRNRIKERLNEITKDEGFEFYERFNDLYGKKGGYEVRRIKGTFYSRVKDDWIHKDVSNKWKEELEKLDVGDGFEFEFKPVNKLISIGGHDTKKELLDRWVNGHEDQSYYYDNDSPSGPPQGTAEEYNYRFDNEDFYFTIRITYKDEIGKYTPSGVLKGGCRDKRKS